MELPIGRLTATPDELVANWCKQNSKAHRVYCKEFNVAHMIRRLIKLQESKGEVKLIEAVDSILKSMDLSPPVLADVRPKLIKALVKDGWDMFLIKSAEVGQREASRNHPTEVPASMPTSSARLPLANKDPNLLEPEHKKPRMVIALKGMLKQKTQESSAGGPTLDSHMPAGPVKLHPQSLPLPESLPPPAPTAPLSLPAGRGPNPAQGTTASTGLPCANTNTTRRGLLISGPLENMGASVGSGAESPQAASPPPSSPFSPSNFLNSWPAAATGGAQKGGTAVPTEVMQDCNGSGIAAVDASTVAARAYVLLFAQQQGVNLLSDDPDYLRGHLTRFMAFNMLVQDAAEATKPGVFYRSVNDSSHHRTAVLALLPPPRPMLLVSRITGSTALAGHPSRETSAQLWRFELDGTYYFVLEDAVPLLGCGDMPRLDKQARNYMDSMRKTPGFGEVKTVYEEFKQLQADITQRTGKCPKGLRAKLTEKSGRLLLTYKQLLQVLQHLMMEALCYDAQTAQASLKKLAWLVVEKAAVVDPCYWGDAES